MALRVLGKAEKELDSMDQNLRALFVTHMKKVTSMPERRHMRHGMPYHVEEVTRQARMIYSKEGEDIFIVRCFEKHKDHERWYESYR